MLSQLCQSTLRGDKTFSKNFLGMCHQSEARAFLRGTKISAKVFVDLEEKRQRREGIRFALNCRNNPDILLKRW